MDTSGLFSHPHVPDPDGPRETTPGPVENPVFSDQPTSQSSPRSQRT